MKRSMILVAAALVALVAFMGCSNPSSSDPDPELDPVKVYLTGTETFTRVDEAGTLAMTDIYQLDTDADGTVDSPAVYYTGSNFVVTLDNSEWVITVGTVKYINTDRIGEVRTYLPNPVFTLTISVVADVVRMIIQDSGSPSPEFNDDYSVWKDYIYNAGAITAHGWVYSL